MLIFCIIFMNKKQNNNKLKLNTLLSREKNEKYMEFLFKCIKTIKKKVIKLKPLKKTTKNILIFFLIMTDIQIWILCRDNQGIT